MERYLIENFDLEPVNKLMIGLLTPNYEPIRTAKIGPFYDFVKRFSERFDYSINALNSSLTVGTNNIQLVLSDNSDYDNLVISFDFNIITTDCVKNAGDFKLKSGGFTFKCDISEIPEKFDSIYDRVIIWGEKRITFDNFATPKTMEDDLPF